MVRYVEARCAVVQIVDGLVVNIIMAQPADMPPDATQLVEVMSGQPCNIGWYWDGTTFIDPNPPPPDEVV